MLSWCSYCQKFVGEIPPYDTLIVTHGICGACERDALTLTDADIARAILLKNIHNQLFEAGRSGDVDKAAQIIEASSAFNIRALDILIGIVSPMLFQIGEDWKRGTITVAQEQRFTRFCENIFELVAARIVGRGSLGKPATESADVLLMNAPGNSHTLAIGILALWLADKGTIAHTVDRPLDGGDLKALVAAIRPRFLLISMALAEQVGSVTRIVEDIGALPAEMRPRIVVGGYAVKLNLVPEIPGAILMADIGVFETQPVDSR